MGLSALQALADEMTSKRTELARVYLHGGEAENVKQLLSIPEDERGLFLKTLEDEAQTVSKPKRSFAGKLGQRVARGTLRTFENVGSMLTDVLGGEAKDEGARQFLAAATSIRRGSQPLKTEGGGVAGTIGDWALGAAELLPPMAFSTAATAATAGAGAGVAGATAGSFWVTQIAPQRYQEFKDHGLSEKTARIAAVASAIPEAALELLQLKQVLGPLAPKVMGEAQRIVVSSGIEFAKKWATHAAKTVGKEALEEGVQSLTASVVKDVASRLSKEAPGVNWRDALADAATETWESIGPLMFLSAPGLAAAGLQTKLAPSGKISDRFMAKFAEQNPEAAALLAQKPIPSRADVQSALDATQMTPQQKVVYEHALRRRGDRAALANVARASQQVGQQEAAPTQPVTTTPPKALAAPNAGVEESGVSEQPPSPTRLSGERFRREAILFDAAAEAQAQAEQAPPPPIPEETPNAQVEAAPNREGTGPRSEMREAPPEEAVPPPPQEAGAVEGWTRDRFATKLREAFVGVKPEHIDAAVTMAEARAKAQGMPIGAWLDKYVADVQMAETAPKGLAPKTRAFVRSLAKDGRIVLTAISTKPTLSTLVHETGHIFRKTLDTDALTAIEAWVSTHKGAKATRGKWNRAAEEIFAEGFEKWTRSPDAANMVPAAVRGAFEKLRDWLVAMFRGITIGVGNTIRPVMTPEIRSAFARMMGAREVGGPTRSDFEAMTIQQLAELGAERGLKLKGLKKAVMVQRLLEEAEGVAERLAATRMAKEAAAQQETMGPTDADLAAEEAHQQRLSLIRQRAEQRRQAAASAPPAIEAEQPAIEEAATEPAAPKPKGILQAKAKPKAPAIETDEARAARIAEREKSLLAEEAAKSNKRSQAEIAALAAEGRPSAQFRGTGLGALMEPSIPLREDAVPDVVKADSAEAEHRLSVAEGIKRKPLAVKLKEIGIVAWAKATRAEEHLPNTPEFGPAHEFFRLLKEAASASADESARRVASIIDPMGPKQRKVFQRVLVAENLAASVERGEPLRFGFQTADEVAAYRDKARSVAEQIPEVKQALETRTAIVKELVGELVRMDLLGKEALNNAESYFHQQVHTKMQLNNVGGGAKPRPIKRSFQKARLTGPESLGEEYDYNTDYIESEATWMADALTEIHKEKLLAKLADKYDIAEQLKEEAKEKGVPLGDVLRDHRGYSIWQPKPGNVFYKAFTVADKVTEAFFKKAAQTYPLTAKDIREVLVVGGKRRQLVLPTEVVQQLDLAEKPKPVGLVAAAADEMMKGWKVWVLLNPKRALAYMLRNITGDIDPVIGGAPMVAKYAARPALLKELRNYHTGHVALSPRMKLARNLGVVSSSMTAKEIPDIKDLAIFRRFYQSRSGAAKVAQNLDWFGRVKMYNEFRENVLRYASFNYYLDQLKAGTLTHYGGARKATVLALQGDMGTAVAAAHLSRNLLGDYGNMTVMGNYLRKRMYPFWSWIEVNMKRWPRMTINALEASKTLGKGNKLATGAYASLGVAQLMLPYAAQWLWNNLMHRDKEEELTDADRASPHVILGRNEDGTVRVFRNVGAFGDFAEWFGLNSFLSLYPRYRDGQITMGDLLKEMAKDPVNKMIQGMRPDLKALYEVPTGQSLYPDVFNPRSQDRGEGVANVVGLSDEYRAAKGLLLQDGSRARPHYLQRIAMGVVDPRQTAMTEMLDLRAKFLKKEGRAEGGVYPISPFRNLRIAAAEDDYEAFKEARQAYIKGGKTFNDFVRSLRNMDPIAQKLGPAAEHKFEYEFLNAGQRARLRVAREYAAELNVKLLGWWRKALAEEGNRR